ncbi:hypothetical protein T11_16607 [Trichinella zimbabwensis]|uniref:Uncharacterized protein n=1 Tax=Trichinella zimbabwensis TaxID=268475 RepID=A0A0V1GXD0_9BILA|nr:hypothetical protein T11_16607 [Trichinella zimbabwensis]
MSSVISSPNAAEGKYTFLLPAVRPGVDAMIVLTAQVRCREGSVRLQRVPSRHTRSEASLTNSSSLPVLDDAVETDERSSWSVRLSSESDRTGC